MRTLTTVMMIALALTACAKKNQAPAPGPASSAAGSTPAETGAFKAQMLGLELAPPSARDAEVPSSDVYQGGIASLDPAYLDAEIILRRTLSLSSTDGGPFLVWPEGEGKDKISAVFFAARTQGVDNQMTGAPNYDVATPDHDSKRFFIPIRKALARRIQDLGPADEQVLSLRVQFVEGVTVDLLLRFRVAGPLTALQVIKDEQLSPNIDGESFLHAGSPIPLRRETFQNPTLRRVALWLKPVRDNLVFIGRFHDLRSTGHGGDPVLQPLNWNERMQLSQIAVIQRGERRLVSYRGTGGNLGSWTVVHVGPGEQVALEWLASSRGCGGTRGNIVGVSAEGSWEMNTWLTDDARPTLPGEFQALPSTLSLATGAISYSAQVRTGDWDGFVFGGNECQ